MQTDIITSKMVNVAAMIIGNLLISERFCSIEFFEELLFFFVYSISNSASDQSKNQFLASIC